MDKKKKQTNKNKTKTNKQKRWSTKYYTENCILTTTNPLKSGDELNWSVVVNSSYSTSGTLVICTAISSLIC